MAENPLSETVIAWVRDLFQYFIDSSDVLGLPAAVGVLILVMVLQAIIAPIVSEAILAAAGGIFVGAFGTAGIYAAIIGGIIGSLLGAIAAFGIARWLQKQAKIRIVDKYADEELETQQPDISQLTRRQRLGNWYHRQANRLAEFLARFIDEDSENFISIIEERGFVIVLIGRIIPFVPFDAVSYASGFTKIRFRDYLIATFIGTVPRVIFFVLSGTVFADLLRENFTLFIIVVAIFAGGIYGMYRWIMRYLENSKAETSLEIDDLKERIESDKEAEATTEL